MVSTSLNQFRHRLTSSLDQVLRAAREVWNRDLADVDAKIVIKRGEHFTKLHRTLGSLAAETIRCADDLSMFHAAACKHCTGDSGPMITPGILVDRWRAPEFAPHNH